MSAILYECDICGCLHRWEFRGDCREDSQRFADEEDFTQRTGETVADVLDMDARVAADNAEPGISDRELYGVHQQPDYEPRS